jgi:integrase
MKITQEELDQFEQFLLSRRNSKGRPECTPRTAHEYAGAVGRVLLAGGDLVEALCVNAKNRSSAVSSMLRSAGKAWATWKKDPLLRARLDEIRVTMSHDETKSADFEDWTRIHDALANVTEPYRSALFLLSITGLRIGDLFMITREQANRALTNFEVTILQKGQKPRVWSPSHEERLLLQSLLVHPWRTVQDVFDHNPEDTTLTDRQHYNSAYGHVRNCRC